MLLCFFRFPHTREFVVKQLKHFVQTERIIYDVSTSAKNAVQVSQMLKQINIDKEKNTPSPAKSFAESASLNAPKSVISHARSWPRQYHAKYFESRSDTCILGCETPPSSFPPTCGDRTAMWVDSQNFQDYSCPENPQPGSPKTTTIEDESIFTSISRVEKETGVLTGRKWSAESNALFTTDFKITRGPRWPWIAHLIF